MEALLTSAWFSFAITWVSPVVLFMIAVAAGVAYHRPISEQRRMRCYMTLAVTAIVFRFIMAGIKTGLQYYAWTLSDVSRFMLPPHQSIGVLLRYSWTHFWLNALISIGAALLFFIILRMLRSYNPRFFETGEVELGFLMALVVGWPQFVVFVPATFLMIVFMSIIRGIFLREPYTTLAMPLFLGAVIAFAATTSIIAAFDLIVLVI